jgi:N-acyl-D-amino-acid deacylase
MQHAGESADLIIRRARLIDGTGGASLKGDIAVRDDRILAMGDLAGSRGAIEIDANGRAVSPGFIDVHTHDDRLLLSDPTMAAKVSQGVTTVVAGNCGISLAPLALPNGRVPPPLDLIARGPEDIFPEFGDYLDRLAAEPAAVNAVCQVGHSTLRIGAMDRLDRPATVAEIKAMRARLEKALDAGAAGLSTGLFYPPAINAETSEVIELAKALKARGGFHSTHMRDEADGIIDSLNETFTIGREAEVPVVISHHKCAGRANHGRSIETLPVIDEARKRQKLGLDAYPYFASSTILDSRRMSGASKVIVTWSKVRSDVTGRDLAEIAAEMGVSPEEAADRLAPAGAIYFSMDEGDVRRILAYPHTMIGSDGLPHDTHPHPRLWGTFPRVLGYYAREIGLFSLEEAVRKMTSLSAAQFGLKDRGVLRPGAYADLVLFDPNTVLDQASFEKPMTPASGIDTVWVNGRAVWRDGAATGQRPGRALRLQDLGPMGGTA